MPRSSPVRSSLGPELPNGDPVLLTRLEPPGEPPTFLRRNRLLRQLDAAVQSPVTLVNGPAGAGKTLVVADWIRHGPRVGPVVWLTVESGDNLPGNFWAYVLEALHNGGLVAPGEFGVPAQADHVEPSLLIRLAAWLNERRRPVILVLDEFEHITDTRLTDQLDELVRHTNGRIRLVLVSRNEPLLPLHRYRAAGQLAEIRAADLALSVSETTEVLKRHGLHPGPAVVEAVHNRLSGWAAGLRLLALAAQEAPDPDTYLKEIDKEHAPLSDFLLGEVLHAQAPATQDLLLRCSVLERVHPDLADTLTGRKDGQRILAELYQANAFIESLPNSWYRLHPMFAGILRLHLHASAPELDDEVRVRAAHWFAQQGQFRAALEHAATGGAWDFAAAVMVDQLALGELFTGRNASELRDLFSRMPPGVRTPAAELVRAALCLSRDDVRSSIRVLERAEPHLPAQDPALQIAAARLRTAVGRLLGSAGMARTAARRAHQLARAAPAEAMRQHPELLSQVDTDLGSALLWQGRLDEAGLALAAAAQATPTAATAQPRYESQCRLALIDYLRGWPGRAERRIRKADDEAERSSLPAEARADVGDLVRAAAALERDDLQAVREALARVTALAKVKNDPIIALGLAVVRANLYVAQGNPNAALQILAEAGDWSLTEHPSPWGRDRVAAALSAAHLAAGHPEAAVQAVADAPGDAPDSVIAAAGARLAAGRDPERTLTQLHALRDASVGVAHRTRATLLFARICADSDQADDQAGSRLLAQALTAAQPERLRRPFRESESWVRRQLRLHPELAEEHPWLPTSLRPAAAVGPVPAADGAPVVEPLSEREREVLVLAARMMSTQEIAEDLYLSPNTVKTHLKSINRKLTTTRRRDAVRKAVALHLLDDS